jgi:hypothetical protein
MTIKTIHEIRLEEFEAWYAAEEYHEFEDDEILEGYREAAAKAVANRDESLLGLYKSRAELFSEYIFNDGTEYDLILAVDAQYRRAIKELE